MSCNRTVSMTQHIATLFWGDILLSMSMSMFGSVHDQVSPEIRSRWPWGVCSQWRWGEVCINKRNWSNNTAPSPPCYLLTKQKQLSCFWLDWNFQSYLGFSQRRYDGVTADTWRSESREYAVDMWVLFFCFQCEPGQSDQFMTLWKFRKCSYATLCQG